MSEQPSTSAAAVSSGFSTMKESKFSEGLKFDMTSREDLAAFVDVFASTSADELSDTKLSLAAADFLLFVVRFPLLPPLYLLTCRIELLAGVEGTRRRFRTVLGRLATPRFSWLRPAVPRKLRRRKL